jgi:LCP family protein required for cell wall assembly
MASALSIPEARLRARRPARADPAKLGWHVVMDAFPQPPGPPGRPPIPGRRTRLGAAITCAALSFLVLIGSGLAWAAFQNFNAGVPHGAAVPPVPAGASDPDGKDQNILLVGNDSRAGASPAELRALSTENDGGSVNTDTMMLLHVPSDGADATVVSFPRDSWVGIPGHGQGKINSAYGLGYAAAKSAGQDEQSAQSAGLILTIRAIEGLTGLHIDHYMQVNLLGFYRISNAIGGVTVCLNAAQNPSTDADQFGHGYSGIDLPKGVSVIKGKQALAFVRQRHGLPGGDLDRIRRQQYFLGAAFRKITSAGVLLNPFKLRDLLTAVGSSVLTDPSLQLLKLGQQFQQMSAGKITFKTIPNLGPQLIYPDGVETSVVKVDAAAMPGFIRGLQGKQADPALAAATPAPASSVTVDVLNATGNTGWAGVNATALRTLGFKVNLVDSADASPDTVVQYPSGMQPAAKAVGAAAPGAKLVLTSTVARPTLVLGGNQVHVTGVHTQAAAGSRPAPAKKPAPAATASAASKTRGLGCIN